MLTAVRFTLVPLPNVRPDRCPSLRCCVINEAHESYLSLQNTEKLGVSSKIVLRVQGQVGE